MYGTWAFTFSKRFFTTIAKTTPRSDSCIDPQVDRFHLLSPPPTSSPFPFSPSISKARLFYSLSLIFFQ